MLSQEELLCHLKTHSKTVWCAVQRVRSGQLSPRELWECDKQHLLLKYYLRVQDDLPDVPEVWFAREALEAYEQFRKAKISV